MSTNPPETSGTISAEESYLEKKLENPSLKDSVDLMEKNTSSETADLPEFTSKLVTNNEVVEGVEKYAERLGMKEYIENKDLWKKFYVVFGPDFVWPPTMKIGERRLVFDYIIHPEWEPDGEELAKLQLNIVVYLSPKLLMHRKDRTF